MVLVVRQARFGPRQVSMGRVMNSFGPPQRIGAPVVRRYTAVSTRTTTPNTVERQVPQSQVTEAVVGKDRPKLNIPYTKIYNGAYIMLGIHLQKPLSRDTEIKVVVNGEVYDVIKGLFPKDLLGRTVFKMVIPTGDAVKVDGKSVGLKPGTYRIYAVVNGVKTNEVVVTVLP